jgi:hypothetical protein
MSGEFIRDLGEGLVLRRASATDAEALATFNSEIHRDSDQQPPDATVAAWVRDLLTQPHPTFSPEDFTIVEDTQRGEIVSSLNLIDQTWTYSGIPFGVGRPELVGTRPAYRTRGLVRAQFEVIHRWSAERGHKLQAITGIPWFYRQFGYEMTVGLGAVRVGYPADVPGLKEGESEPYQFRPATLADVPFLEQVYEYGSRRSLLACARDQALWRYELCGRSEASCNHAATRIISAPGGEPLGYLRLGLRLHRTEMVLTAYELKPGVSWADVAPTVLRYLRATGEEYAAREHKEFRRYVFGLGEEHPAYRATPHWLPRAPRPYAWYVRIADLPDFVRHIAPALEQRLAASECAGHSAELKLNFYRSGLRLLLEKGRLTAVEPWTPAPREWGNARFPGLTFLQLLTGYRTLEELEYAFADCAANDEAQPLLKLLFPRQSSTIWPVD